MSTRRSFRLSHLTLGTIGAALLAGGIASDASAAWPPPETATCADLSTPDYWPNDPGWAPEPKRFNQGRSGAWEFFCFIPERSEGAPPVRQGETASGMSVDMAFRYTQGDPRVVIAVLDSGIKWEEADLIEAAYLNIGELQNHKPLDKDGQPCGGEGELEGFDCNGDGQLTVADYADDARVGDRNGNGVIDAGDIILAFSDGVDDDGNGYIDDISGWDFLKNDNDPYDDTRYGHGTGEAKDSVARANNGIGGVGMCPSCRYMALRVGDSFITDVNNFADAVIYATDNGAKVVQEALGTINNSKYAMAALDYAYAKGVTTIASMADENARHHNMPAVNNHTLPTHAIAPGPSPDATSAETFFAFNLCTNYGAHNFLSASSKSCSSGAVGNLSGMTGLLYSAGLKYLNDQGKAGLTAGEVYQLWMMTADDIDVPESRQTPAKYFWSQPGFDQRFGYGRPNANTAVEYVKEGKIPPEVDIVSPTWYEVLYRDKVEGPVSIKGSVSAKRAPSYSYYVEAAPGVQPLDTAFQLIASMENIPGTEPIEGELAQFDIRTFDVTHERDVDSPLGENDHTVTVRVRAIAHYGGEIGDVRGELRRAYYIYSDPSLVKGFPIRLSGSGESSPKLADIDGDGLRDIVLATADGEVHAISLKDGSPKPIEGFPVKLPRLYWLDPDDPGNHLKAPAYQPGAGNVDPDLGRDGVVATPAIADIDGDGKNEIVVSSYQGSIYVIGSDGAMKPGWPVKLPYIPSCPLDPNAEKPEGDCMDTANIVTRGAFASPVLADMDKDGKLDIIQAGFDGRVHVFKADGTPVDGWPVLIHYSGDLVQAKERNRIMTTPAVADVNGDGYPDLLVGSNEKLGEGGGAGAFYLVDGRGNNAGYDPPYFPNWPVTMPSLNIFPLVGEGVPNSPVFADFDGDGVPEAVMHGNVSTPFIVPVDPGVTTKLSQTPPNAIPCHPDPNDPEKTVCGLYSSSIFGEISKAAQPNTMFPLFSMPSAADIDQDGIPDVIASGGSLNLAINMTSQTGAAPMPGENLLAVWSGKTGAMLPGSPMVIADFTFFNNQAVADLNNDGYPEILTGSGGYFVHAYDGCGREPEGFPKFTGQWIIGTVAVGDLDGDDKLEIVAPTRNGWLYAWHTEGRSDGNIQWESFHHDNRNTGNLATPLEQGHTDLAPTPLSCPVEGEDPAALADPEAEGGCGCTVKPSQGRVGWLLSGLALAAALLRRRRSN